MKTKLHRPELIQKLKKRTRDIVKLLSNHRDAIPVQDLVEALNVKKVVFRPIPADALLTKLPEGFGIHVNCKDFGPDYLNELYRNEGKPNWLPNQIRFTFAHEFAHIIVEEFSGEFGGSVSLFSEISKDAVNLLESTCNKLASEILLPRSRFDQFLMQSTEPFEPLNVMRIANRFRVSPDVILYRLAHHKRTLNCRYWKGCVYLIEFSNNKEWQLISSYKSDLFSLKELRCETKVGKGSFLGRWSFDSGTRQPYFEESFRHLTSTVNVRCLTQEIWRRGRQSRLLVSLCEGER